MDQPFLPDFHPTHEIDPPFRFCPLCGGKLNKKKIKPSEPDRLVCSLCSFVYYLDPKVATGTVTLFENRIVFVDRGETLEEAAIRETLEETGLQVRVISLLNVYSYPGKAVVVVVYLAEAMAGVPEACDETLEVGLFQYEKIPWEDLAFPSTREALRDYRNRFALPDHNFVPKG
jgi:8-oxo-dGTP diphosphatase